jgi:hypothetical protein
LSDRHENSFVFMLCRWCTHASLTVYFVPAVRLPILSVYRITILLNVASYVKCFSMSKNWQKTEHTWIIRMSGNDWTEIWWLAHSLRGGGDDVAWWLTLNMFTLGSF